MKWVVFTFLTLSALFANAQRTDSITRYYNSEFKITDTPEYASYFGISIFKNSLWAESAYYVPAYKLYSYGLYRDKEHTIPVDSFYSFHLSGELQSIGNYINGKKDGLWRKYHQDGSLWGTSSYKNGTPVNTHLSWHPNGFPSDSTIWFETGGLSFSWNDEGKIHSIGPYNLSQERQGSWKFYYSNGKLGSVAIYNKGELKDFKSFDENGKSLPNHGINTPLEVESVYPGGARGWQNFLSNLEYPEAASKRDIEGTVIVQFIVDTKGALSQIKAISGPAELREEAVRLISKSGRWIPAFHYGIPVKSYKKQPFVFRLE